MIYMMTIHNNDGKTSLSRQSDIEGTEEIRPCVLRNHDWITGVVNSIFRKRVSDVMFLGQMFLRTSPRRLRSECATLAPLPFPLA